jgi:hypothetical protein
MNNEDSSCLISCDYFLLGPTLIQLNLNHRSSLLRSEEEHIFGMNILCSFKISALSRLSFLKIIASEAVGSDEVSSNSKAKSQGEETMTMDSSHKIRSRSKLCSHIRSILVSFFCCLYPSLRRMEDEYSYDCLWLSIIQLKE